MSQFVQYGRAKLIGLLTLTVINIVSVAMLIWLAAKGRSVLVVFPFSVGAWACYMSSHYLVEGTFIDESSPGKDHESSSLQHFLGLLGRLPSSPARRVLATGGVGSMILTFPTGIVAVGNEDFTLLLVSASLFVGGYMLGHQGFTGKPL